MNSPEMSTHRVLEEIGACGEHYQWATRILIQAFARSGTKAHRAHMKPSVDEAVRTIISRLNSDEIKLFMSTLQSIQWNDTALELLTTFVNQHHFHYETVDLQSTTQIREILHSCIHRMYGLCYPLD